MAASGSQQSCPLLQLPYDVFLDCLLPFIPTADLVRLRQACKMLQQWTDNDFIWRRRIQDDFNFPPHASARVTGWQQLYRGLSSPSVFVWGQSDHGRLGIREGDIADEKLRGLVFDPAYTAHGLGGAPFPLRLDYRRPSEGQKKESIAHRLGAARGRKAVKDSDGVGTPIKVVAGGWSFHALTSTGRILYWGQMDGDLFTHEEIRAESPAIMDLSCSKNGRIVRVKQLSCGRKHAVSLTESGSILEWKAWDGVRVHDEPFAPLGQGRANVVQLEAGWDFTAVLVEEQPSGDPERTDTASSISPQSHIIYWHTDWVSTGDPPTTHSQGTHGSPSSSDSEFSMSRWRDVHRVLLPALPTPPEEVAKEMDIDFTEQAAEATATRTPQHQRIAQVAAGEDYVLALTSHGLVFKLDVSPVAQGQVGVDLHNNDELARTRAANALRRAFDEREREWQLMEHFCVPSRIAALAAFSSGDGRLAGLVRDREKLRIKHISAQFRTWAAYSTFSTPQDDEASNDDHGGIVLLGKGDSTSSTGPSVKSELQGTGVIKISVGDWHYGALTTSGKVLTWGQWSQGALGIWDSLPVAPPQPQMQRPPRRIGNMVPLLGGRHFRVGLAGARVGGPQGGGQPQGQDGGDSPSSSNDRLALRVIPHQGVERPTQVRFDGDEEKAKRTFVFDIAFAGWHSAAIAVDSRLLRGGRADDWEGEAEQDGERLEEDDGHGQQDDATLHGGLRSSASPNFHVAPLLSPLPPQQGRSVTSSASTIPAVPLSPGLGTPTLPNAERRAPPADAPASDPERQASLIYTLSLLFLLFGLGIVLLPPAGSAWLSDDNDGMDGSIGEMVVMWLTRLGFCGLLLIPVYLYATIARWVGESTGRG